MQTNTFTQSYNIFIKKYLIPLNRQGTSHKINILKNMNTLNNLYLPK
jgi:hypothetical protein